jgi:hypothetical protein
MKQNFKILSLLIAMSILTGCASGYDKITPKNLNYLSKNTSNDVTLEYKYGLLTKKYEKKEEKNDIKLVALKITNNSNVDYTFGNNLSLTYENGNTVFLLESDKTFKTIKQSPASYLWYLLLTPIQLFKTTTNQYGQPESESIFPIGLILGPGIAGANMLGASDANKNFKNDLTEYNIIGKTIKKGETVYGLIGLQSKSYEALKLKLE